MTAEKLLRRARAVLADVGCQATGCYVASGHRPACVRGRAEKVIAEIDAELERRRLTGTPTEIGL